MACSDLADAAPAGGAAILALMGAAIRDRRSVLGLSRCEHAARAGIDPGLPQRCGNAIRPLPGLPSSPPGWTRPSAH